MRYGVDHVNSFSGRAPMRRGGFSLVELLVVVSLIVVLIALLLPGLRHAREAARSMICQSNLRQAVIAFNTYAVQNRSYIAGANTSGYHLLDAAGPDLYTRATDPITFDDWMSPILGDMLGLSADRNTRLVEIFNDEFRCPSNFQTYDYIYPNGAGWPAAGSVYMNSYSSPLPLHYYYDGAHAASRSQPFGRRFGNQYDQAVDIRPARHKFKLSTLGNPSGKVAAMDGARYLDATGRVSFNVDNGSPYGGNFMNRSPGLNAHYQANGNPYKFDSDGVSLHPDSQRLSYRHLDVSMNVSFFDGHTENLSHEASRKASYWFPSGSVVEATNRGGPILSDTTLEVGDVIE